MSIEGTVAKVILGTLGSSMLAVGGMSWQNHTDNQTQEIRLAQLERAITEISELNDRLAVTNQNIAILNVKLTVLQGDIDDLEDELDSGE